MKNLYKIADVIFEIEYFYKFTGVFFSKFLYKGEKSPQEKIIVTKKDLEEESLVSNITQLDFVENSCVLRKLAYLFLQKHQGLLFHASSIKYNDKAYLFTAKSGTGKSTHTKLLKDLLGDEVEYINDDKPLLKYNENGEVIVYGNPWNGKHFRGENISAPLKAIVKVVRSEENSVKEISPIEGLSVLFEQAYKPLDSFTADKLLEHISKILGKTKFYVLNCNMSVSAAQCSFDNILSK